VIAWANSAFPSEGDVVARTMGVTTFALFRIASSAAPSPSASPARLRARPGISGTGPRSSGSSPGSSPPAHQGSLCLVSATSAHDVADQMPDAQEVKTVPVDGETAQAVKEAAKAAGDTASS